ncbi:MAG TPA: hypothetical protein VN616_04535 [Puia sp.]|nr:hypothetical protein [Puia sp.]
MRRHVPAAIFASLVLFPFCAKTSKTPVPPPFTLTATLNGTPATFNAVITVDSASTPGTVYIVGNSDSANLTPLLEVSLTSNRPLAAGTYSFPDTSGGNSGTLGYTAWRGGTAVQYPRVTDTIVLTTVNANWLSGTFQGTCAYSPDSVVTITNGKFTVGWNQR